MVAERLRNTRRNAGWTEVQAASRLGISQSYLAMLEAGQRRVTTLVARQFMQVYGLGSDVLPLPESYTPNSDIDAAVFARRLASLGYPGFVSLQAAPPEVHPAEVLLDGLAQGQLEARSVEALPWLLMRYSGMDLEWLMRQTKLHDLQNRLGFVANLARQALEKSAAPNRDWIESLKNLEQSLAPSRLAKEDTLMKRASAKEREWLKQSRSEEARFWNLLTDWRVEHLSYTV